MHGSRSKIASKIYLVRQRCAEGFNSAVKELNYTIFYTHGERNEIVLTTGSSANERALRYK
jgi:hypothetical protein